MPDSSKFPALSARPNVAPGQAPASDAEPPATFASPLNLTTHILVRGPAWAEYHLLLGPTDGTARAARRFTRIEREIRTLGGAPLVARLLARWRVECQGARCAPVEIRLSLGRDPNARLLRRELEAYSASLPALKPSLAEDEGAPEVPYRILMWAAPGASTQSAPNDAPGALPALPRVMQCGEMGNSPIIVETAGAPAGAPAGAQPVQVLEAPVVESAGSEVEAAARAWAVLLGMGAERAEEMARSARAAWHGKAILERVECDVGWGEIERGAGGGA